MKNSFLFVILVFLFACNEPPLPILGRKTPEGKNHQIPDFSFINQDGKVITNATFENKAYVADFFFIHCPSICPKVTKQMLRLHDKYKDDDRLLLLAHSLDPKRDTVGSLHKYAQKLGVSSDKWHLVTGNKDDIYDINDDYLSIAIEDDEAPGGINHSGKLILVDKNRHIRGFCEGTDPDDVTRFMKDIDRLLKE